MLLLFSLYMDISKLQGKGSYHQQYQKNIVADEHTCINIIFSPLFSLSVFDFIN